MQVETSSSHPEAAPEAAALADHVPPPATVPPATVSPATLPAPVPRQHGGEPYVSVLQHLAKVRAVKRYLEVGVFTGACFAQIPAERAIGVDPSFRIAHNIAVGKTDIRLFQMPSDLFFAEVDVLAAFDGPVDFAFLDGMHQFEYLLRDIANTERVASPRGLIALHDCLPLSEPMTLRSQDEARRKAQGSPYERWWTGDVWKVIPILRKYRPDLKIVCVDAPPTGLVFISNLDPSNDSLQRDYCRIVEEFAALPSDGAALVSFYGEIEVLPTQRLTAGFDHSLLLRA